MGLGKTLGLGAAVVAAVVAAMPLVVPAAAGMAGFGEHGIVAGSWAAALMRRYGGAVPAGSWCALLQRVGSRGGLETSTVVGAECVAAALAGLSAFFFRRAQPALIDQEPAYHELRVEESADEEEVDHADAEAESARFSATEEPDDVDDEEEEEAHRAPSPAEIQEPSRASSSAANSNHAVDDPCMLFNPFALTHLHSSPTTLQ